MRIATFQAPPDRAGRAPRVASGRHRRGCVTIGASMAAAA